MSKATGAAAAPTVLTFAPRGAGLEVFNRREAEVLLVGAAGTGKTRCVLEKIHLQACQYPGMRAVLLRKTHASLTATALQTYQKKVLHPLDGVKFFGGSAVQPPQFRYPNGSQVLVGGLDKPEKILSTEFDVAYVNEATELTENDWETVTTRLRNGKMPYQQIIGDCNPSAPTHWLKRRGDSGKLVMLTSRHEDNPTYWDPKRREWTPAGAAYMAKLESLTGVRYLRFRKGIWAAAEGVIYDGWSEDLHVVDHIPAAAGTKRDAAGVPLGWSRYWCVDFGYTNPFVWQAWAESPDGDLYRYQEIYWTQRLVEDHAETIRRVTQGQPYPVAIICDHDAEDRATLERKLGLPTLAAFKSVSPGIQAVASRLKLAGHGRPRLFLVRDGLVERDPLLVDAKLPTCTEEEIGEYVWDEGGGRKKGDAPVKKDDHGMDAMRYLVAFVDSIALDPSDVEEIVVYDDRYSISDY